MTTNAAHDYTATASEPIAQPDAQPETKRSFEFEAFPGGQARRGPRPIPLTPVPAPTLRTRLAAELHQAKRTFQGTALGGTRKEYAQCIALGLAYFAFVIVLLAVSA